MAIGKSQILGRGVIDLGIAVCYKVLEQRGGQDVVSLGLGESCEPCVSQTEKLLVAGEPTEEMFYLKELHGRSCPPPVAQGQGSELGHHSTQDMQTLTWGAPQRGLNPSGELCREEVDTAGARRGKCWKTGGGEGGVAQSLCPTRAEGNCVAQFHPALAELVLWSQLSKSILGFPGARREEGAPGSPAQ